MNHRHAYGPQAVVNRWGRRLLPILVMLATTGAAAAEDLTVDDFESYPGSQVIGSKWRSKPWARFGPATIDNVVATSKKKLVLSGSVSAQYSVAWAGPLRRGAARIQRAD